jgi:hypothetical protein
VFDECFGLKFAKDRVSKAASRVNAKTIFVGYNCPQCGGRVIVFSSHDHPAHLAAETTSQCVCGYVRGIPLELIQSLQFWQTSEDGK